jgi:hypothetical protein
MEQGEGRVGSEICERLGEAFERGEVSGARIHFGIEQGGFHGEGAAEMPGSNRHVFDEADLDVVGGLEAIVVALLEVVEGFFAFATDGCDFGQQSVLACVLGRARFAFWSYGAVGERAISAGRGGTFIGDSHQKILSPYYWDGVSK